MQLSRYLKTYPYHEKHGYILIYSTKKTSLALLPEDTFEELRQGKIPGEHKDSLVKLGILVESREEETKEMLSFHDEINRLAPGLMVSIILNLECNFDCKYCYEGSLKSKKFMTRETADATIDYLKKRFKPGSKKLLIHFYGGEPLLSPDLVRYFAEKLKPFVEEQGALFEFTLVSNGSLLTPELAEELTGLGLASVKITVDGPAENHNYYRPYKSGRASFDAVVGNIKACCEKTRIKINGNYTEDNYQQFPLLLDHFEEVGLGPDNLASVEFYPVQKINNEFSTGYCGGCESLNEAWLAPASMELREDIMERGYPMGKLSPATCMMEMEHGFTVHYDGTLYKCPAIIGHEKYAVGDVWSGMTDGKDRYHLNNWRKNEECLECEYLPLCFAGCRLGTFEKDGDMAAVDCRRQLLDATLETFLKQDLKYSSNAASASNRKT